MNMMRVATVLTVYGIETGLQDHLRPSLPRQQLQQHLPFTVLKHFIFIVTSIRCVSCNSTYRLRYATKGARQQRSEETRRTAHL